MAEEPKYLDNILVLAIESLEIDILEKLKHLFIRNYLKIPFLKKIREFGSQLFSGIRNLMTYQNTSSKKNWTICGQYFFQNSRIL